MHNTPSMKLCALSASSQRSSLKAVSAEPLITRSSNPCSLYAHYRMCLHDLRACLILSVFALSRRVLARLRRAKME